MMGTFTMVVEESPSFERSLQWDGSNVPDVIIDDASSTAYVRIGTEFNSESRFTFRRAHVLQVEL